MRPLISVILPAFNCADHLEAAVASIFQQTAKDLELIVIDDASTDRTPQILKRIRDSRLIVLQHACNQGYPAAMNTGLRRSCGEFIARMDADDVSAPERLAKQLDLYRQLPDLALVGTRFKAMTPRGAICSEASGSDVQSSKSGWVAEDWASIRDGRRHFADPSVMCRKKDVLEVGGYRTYQRSGQDVDLWLRLLERAHTAATIVEPLYFRRLRLDMMSLDPGASARNKIPRVLADERRHCGTDSVMRGEPLPQATEEAQTKAPYWRLIGFWDAADHCLLARDFRSGWSFVRQALVLGGFSKTSAVRMLRFLRLTLIPRTERHEKGTGRGVI